MNLEKKVYRIVLVISTIFLFTFCDHHVDNYDNTPPSPPEEVITFVGDSEVEITWDENRERDVAGYNVYFAYSYNGEYELIGNTNGNFFIDYEAINGEVYYYAVTAYDYDGNESELSYDEVYGVARPEGKNQIVFDYLKFPEIAGYDFSEYLVVPFNENTTDQSADFFFENFNGDFYLNVWDDTDIQDMGFTDSFLDITYAPINGWVQLLPEENVKYTLAEVGHTYVIWTWDNHYAKIRINSISDQRIVFDWAYQLLEGEPLLKSNRNGSVRAELPKQVSKVSK